ncbi:T9SS C-terminal target domain-containing protein [bacterium]|nr:MAG: T9SS C-terminal target domain-containing protein [bacterium]
MIYKRQNIHKENDIAEINCKAEIDLSGLSSGIYLYQLKTDDYNNVKRMIIK